MVALAAHAVVALFLTDNGSAEAAQDMVNMMQVSTPVDPALDGEEIPTAVNALIPEEETAEDITLAVDLDEMEEDAGEEFASEFADASDLNELVQMQAMPANLSKEEFCLAGTVYFESKGESLQGQLAVAKVVLNRRDSGRFPNSICGVVYQRSQFSFVRGGRMPSINTNSQSWRRAVAISQIALGDHWESAAENALFFHAKYVNPRWKLKRVAQIDKHIFYR